MIKEEWTTEEILEDITKQLDLVIDNNNKDRALLITRIRRKIRNINKLVESNEKLYEENQQLKELLSKCLDELAEFNNSYYPETQELFSQITNAIGEKK